MRYTTRALKTAVPLYRGTITPKHKSGRILSDPGLEEKEFYARRITELELELETLNILDHPLKIVDICIQINILRKQISRFEN